MARTAPRARRRTPSGRGQFVSAPGHPGGTGALRQVRRRSAWDTSVDRFLAWKRSETSVGEGWLRRMRWELRRFPGLVARLGGRGIRAPGDVAPEDIFRLKDALGWERATFALHFAALRQFLRWAKNPAAARPAVWSLPSGVSSHRRWLTRTQFTRLFRGSTGLRRLLVGLEGLNGLRRVEVLRLRAQDVALTEGCLRVLGKGRDGGKWRTIPIHDALRPLLGEATRRRGGAERLYGLSASGLDHLLREAVVESGLDRTGIRVSHHDLRRTFGRLAHQAGMDMVQLKNLYGHQSLEQTVHYIGFDSDEMREGLRRLDLGEKARPALVTE
jgi:integrase